MMMVGGEDCGQTGEVTGFFLAIHQAKSHISVEGPSTLGFGNG